MTDKELDELLYRKVKEYEDDVNLNINVYEITNIAQKRKFKSVLISISSIAACFLVTVICLINLFNNLNKSNIVAENDIQEQCGIIDVEPQEGNSSASILTDDLELDYDFFIESNRNKDILDRNEEYVNDIVIARINDLSYTNYDMVHRINGYNPFEGYDYVPPRTIANITITKSLEGVLKEGESIEIRANGGILEYSEYMKYWKNNNYSSLNEEYYDQKYNALIEQGKTKIYVSEFRKTDIKLEKGKSYLMVVYKKVLGDYWTETYNTILREYNVEDGTVLNNKTGKYEKLEDVLKMED